MVSSFSLCSYTQASQSKIVRRWVIHTHTHTVGLIGERKASDKYTAVGCRISLSTLPRHLVPNIH